MRIKTTPAGSYLPLTGGTLTGDLTIGANKIKTTNLLIKEGSGSDIFVRNLADSGYRDLHARYLWAEQKVHFGASATLDAKDSNAAVLPLRARDTDSQLVNVARLVGAADPYLEMTLPFVLKPAAMPGAPVEGMIAYDPTLDELQFRDALATRRIFGASSPLVLKAVKKTVNYDDTSPVTVATLPAGSLILACVVNVSTLFEGTSPTLDIGDAGNDDGFFPAEDLVCTSAGWKHENVMTEGTYLYDTTHKKYFKLYASETAVLATIGGTNLTAGVADVYILYMELS